MRIQTFLRLLRSLIEPALEPRSPEAYARRGMARFNDGDDERAIADFKVSIRMNPSFAAYHGRGGALLGKCYFEEAIADLTVAIELNPSSAETYYLRCIAYARLRDADNTLADAIVADRLGLRDAEARHEVKALLDAAVSGWSEGEFPHGLREEVKAFLDAAAREKERKD